ncbi:hypothetical protein KCP69_09985 [Salmonella enterica subsp. enterica]|nr:hypothetical protein KCP69_09985 [Salmonella enterica subsp. enterica]
MAAAKISRQRDMKKRKDNVKTISGLKDSQFEWDRLAEGQLLTKSLTGLFLIYEDW